MIDKNAIYLLNYVKNTSLVNYSIFDYDEVILDFPKNYYVTKIRLDEIIKTLNNSGYINLKYNDGNTFCCCLTEKGRAFEEETSQINANWQIVNDKFMGWCVFSSFIGGFLGCIIAFFLIYIGVK